jgi:hypothetical protein
MSNWCKTWGVGGVLLALLMGSGATANEVPPVWLPLHRHAELQRQQQAATDDYQLALGAWRRAAGEWRLEQTSRLSGELSRMTFRISESGDPAGVQQLWLEQLRPLATQVLFSCRGRACGPSNLWANSQFGVAELYGLDDQQYYDALELERDGRRYALALYTVQRGNRRLYSHIDLLALGDRAVELTITASAVLAQWREQGRVVLALDGAKRDALDEAELNALARALQQDSQISIYAVGHAQGPGPLQQLIERSTGYAATVCRQLQQRGIAAERCEPHGVGPLAPGGRRGDRIELLLKPR